MSGVFLTILIIKMGLFFQNVWCCSQKISSEKNRCVLSGIDLFIKVSRRKQRRVILKVLNCSVVWISCNTHNRFVRLTEFVQSCATNTFHTMCHLSHIEKNISSAVSQLVCGFLSKFNHSGFMWTAHDPQQRVCNISVTSQDQSGTCSHLDCGGFTVRGQYSERLQWLNLPEATKEGDKTVFY